MIRGLYTAVSGMLATARRMEVVVNNLANSGTTGYKQERTAAATFSDEMIYALAAHQNPQSVGRLGMAIVPEAPELDLSQGPIQSTGRQLDIALEGPGFLTIQTPEGERYTRDGSLTRDAAGYLTTTLGARVLGENGPIRAPAGEVTFDPDGTVLLDGAPVDRLRVVEFGPDVPLEKLGLNQYAPVDGGAGPQPAAETAVRQGFIEGSNVDLTGTMTNILQLQRTYEANQRMIQQQDELLARAANEIAKPTP